MRALPRDFIETAEGLLFAVVDPALEDGKVLCFLRYAPDGTGRRKLDTAAANAVLRRAYPRYLHHSVRLDADLHAVPEGLVRRHYRPRERTRTLFSDGAQDPIEAKLLRLLRYFERGGVDPGDLGVTGSLLIGAHTPGSDLDLVLYDRDTFCRARQRVRSGIKAGDLAELDETAWRDTYRRRACALRFDEYLWHERRKGNKALFEGTKFDLTLVRADAAPPSADGYRKRGRRVLRCTVRDADAAFDYPAVYRVEGAEVSEILAFTHTYTGQAFRGETIEAAGLIEEDQAGRRRLVVGSSREAPGEYIRVLHPSDTSPG